MFETNAVRSTFKCGIRHAALHTLGWKSGAWATLLGTGDILEMRGVELTKVGALVPETSNSLGTGRSALDGDASAVVLRIPTGDTDDLPPGETDGPASISTWLSTLKVRTMTR